MPEISKTVDQALGILDYVSRHAPVSPTVVARSLAMHRTVVHRALATLLLRGYVRRTETGYVPGLALLRLSEKVEPELLAASRPTLEKLAERYGETFILTVPDGGEAVQIDQVVGSEHVVRVELVKGFSHSLAKGASGRAILAFMEAERLAAATRGVADGKALQTALNRVKRDGYAMSHDELSQDLWGLSVPLFAGREVVGSIGVVVPGARQAVLQDLVKVMIRASAQVGKALHR